MFSQPTATTTNTENTDIAAEASTDHAGDAATTPTAWSEEAPDNPPQSAVNMEAEAAGGDAVGASAAPNQDIVTFGGLQLDATMFKADATKLTGKRLRKRDGGPDPKKLKGAGQAQWKLSPLVKWNGSHFMFSVIQHGDEDDTHRVEVLEVVGDELIASAKSIAVGEGMTVTGSVPVGAGALRPTQEQNQHRLLSSSRKRNAAIAPCKMPAPKCDSSVLKLHDMHDFYERGQKGQSPWNFAGRIKMCWSYSMFRKFGGVFLNKDGSYEAGVLMVGVNDDGSTDHIVAEFFGLSKSGAPCVVFNAYPDEYAGTVDAKCGPFCIPMPLDAGICKLGSSFEGLYQQVTALADVPLSSDWAKGFHPRCNLKPQWQQRVVIIESVQDIAEMYRPYAIPGVVVSFGKVGGEKKALGSNLPAVRACCAHKDAFGQHDCLRGVTQKMVNGIKQWLCTKPGECHTCDDARTVGQMLAFGFRARGDKKVTVFRAGPHVLAGLLGLTSSDFYHKCILLGDQNPSLSQVAIQHAVLGQAVKQRSECWAYVIKTRGGGAQLIYALPRSGNTPSKLPILNDIFLR